MFKALVEQRKRLAVLTAVILVIQSILPISWMGTNVARAGAETQTWDFNAAGDYLLDTNISIFDYDGTGDGVAHFYDTWTSTGYGTGLPAALAVRNIEYASDGTLWATMEANGGDAYKSTDGGATWSSVATGVTNNLQIIETTDTDLIAVGDDGAGNPASYYSDDSGANWNVSGIALAAGATGWVSVTWDTTNSKAYAVDDVGHTYVSSDKGQSWGVTAVMTAIVPTPTDIICTSSNTIIMVGYDAAAANAGHLAYTTNGGAGWSEATLPGTPKYLRTAAYIGGWLYVGGGVGGMGGSIYATNLNLGGGGTLNDPADWTDISAAMGTGTAVMDFASYQSIPFAAVATAGDPTNIVSTLDNGAHWLSHTAIADTNGPIRNGALVDTGTVLLFGSAETVGGAADVWKATAVASDTSMVTATGIAHVGSVTSVTATYHALNTGEIKIAFGLTAGGTTWYYYDTATGSWKTSDTDAPAFATKLSDLLPAGVLGSWPLGGNTIYLKIYPTGTAPILDDLTVGYTTGGTPPSEDKTAPESQVVKPDSPYSTTEDRCFDSKLAVTATASDGNSGVRDVALYISLDGDNYVLWGDASNPDTSAPYSWNVPVKHGETWSFYSVATDNNNNVEDPPASWDAMTTIDLLAPQIPFNGGTDPRDGQGIYHNYGEPVVIAQPIRIYFSEPIVTNTFRYEFYKSADAQKTPVAGLSVVWSEGDTKIVVSHSGMDYETEYTFDITNATDEAGNQLNSNSCSYPCGALCYQPPQNDAGDHPEPEICRWGGDTSVMLCPDHIKDLQFPAPKKFTFKTQRLISPNLFPRLEVPNGPNGDGSYNTGDEAQFTLTLENLSGDDATNVAAKISIPDELTYVRTDNPGGGTMVPISEGGRVVRLEWRNSSSVPIRYGFPVVVKFTVKINIPYLGNSFNSKLTANIYDNENYTEEPDVPLPCWDSFKIAHDAVVTTSQMTVSPTTVRAGDTVTYSVSLANTGTTLGDIEFSDFVPAYDNSSGQPPIFFGPGPINFKEDSRWTIPPYYDEATQTVRAKASGVLPNSSPLTFSFEAVARGTIEVPTTITNTAYVWDALVSPPEKSEVKVTVDVEEGDPSLPLQIVYYKPALDHPDNNPLKQPIEIGFNRSVLLDDTEHPFTYSLAESGYEFTPAELEDWKPTWSEREGHSNALFTLTPPLDPANQRYGELTPGAVYKVIIKSAFDAEDKSGLKDAPKEWEFTTADPVVRIVSPAVSLVYVVVGQESVPFIVKLVDSLSEEDYLAEENISIGLRAHLGVQERETGSFWNSSKKALGENPHITIAQGSSTATFYYQDTMVSTPNFLTILALEDPNKGWPAGTKLVEVIAGERPLDSLKMGNCSTSVKVGRFSSPINITAQSVDGSTLTLPDKLYFYSSTTTGAFYDLNQNKLPYLLVAQNDENGMPQYLTTDGDQTGVTVYFKDSVTGLVSIAIADNYPQWPDTGLANAAAVMSVYKALDEEELLEELEEVEDDTGRIIDRVEIKPSETTLLPNGKQVFKAIGYDTDGKVIETLKFKWHVLIEKSGTIDLNGTNGDSSTSTFVAGKNLGTYYDDVLVATLYNGKIGYTVAIVKIADVVNYHGPKRLPVTGMNGLQLILLGLTLAAAVALAWVEHYDKTHFSKENMG
ncbi:MAG: hypothetical protein WC553_03540 [Patescibacteria group bacterium]